MKKSRVTRRFHRICIAMTLVLTLLPLTVFPAIAVAEATDTGSGGNFTNLIVFVRFQNEPEFINDLCNETTSVKTVVENSYNKAEYSVSDYYARVSNGKVKMENVYLKASDGGSVTLGRPRGYYCTKDDTNPIGYTQDAYYRRMYELKQDWSNAIFAAFSGGGSIENADGTRRYSLSDLDRNGDGRIDSLTILYKYSDRYSVSWSDCLWNYQDFYDGLTLSSGDTSLQSGAYLQLTANFNYLYTDAGGVPFASLKTMIHEMGHIFGLKDLYRSGMNSRVYYMSAMSHALSPVPQYLSAKERETLGWLGAENIRSITAAGTYTIELTTDAPPSGVVCYKIDLLSASKTVYLEYRRFDSAANKYDDQTKTIYNAAGQAVKGLTLKSGLVCFLADKDVRFPNNLNTSGSHWSYEVLGGTYATKSDAALGAGDSLMLSATVEVQVTSVTDTALTFRIIGDGIAAGHTHAATHVPDSAPTCLAGGHIAYYYCAGCQTRFSDAALEKPISEADTLLPPNGHKKVPLKGYAPTCTSHGMTDGEKCSVCDTVLKAQEDIEPLPHTPGDWLVDQEASADEEGRRHKECTRCHQLLVTEAIPCGKPNAPDSGGLEETPPPSGDGAEPSEPSTPDGGDIEGPPPSGGTGSDEEAPDPPASEGGDIGDPPSCDGGQTGESADARPSGCDTAPSSDGAAFFSLPLLLIPLAARRRRRRRL